MPIFGVHKYFAQRAAKYINSQDLVNPSTERVAYGTEKADRSRQAQTNRA